VCVSFVRRNVMWKKKEGKKELRIRRKGAYVLLLLS